MRIIETINVLNFNTSNANDMSSVFAECKSLSLLDLSILIQKMLKIWVQCSILAHH